MKGFILILCLICSVAVGQVHKRQLSEESIAKFDSLIIYSRNCAWDFSEQRWIGVIQGMAIRGSSEGKSDTTVRQEFASMIDGLKENRFWEIDADSLDIRSWVSRGETYYYGISDGCRESIHFINKESRLSLSGYELDAYQEKIFVQNRQFLIRCRDLVLASFRDY